MAAGVMPGEGERSQAVPSGEPEWATGAGCLGLGGLLVALPLGYFWSEKVGGVALAIIALLSVYNAVARGAATRERAQRKVAEQAHAAEVEASVQAILENARRAALDRRNNLAARWGEEIAERIVNEEIWR